MAAIRMEGHSGGVGWAEDWPIRDAFPSQPPANVTGHWRHRAASLGGVSCVVPDFLAWEGGMTHDIASWRRRKSESCM